MHASSHIFSVTDYDIPHRAVAHFYRALLDLLGGFTTEKLSVTTMITTLPKASLCRTCRVDMLIESAGAYESLYLLVAENGLAPQCLSLPQRLEPLSTLCHYSGATCSKLSLDIGVRRMYGTVTMAL